MIWHAKKLMSPPSAEDWNNSSHIIDFSALAENLVNKLPFSEEVLWEPVLDQTFTSATQFTISNLDDYSMIRVFFNVYLVGSSGGDNAIYVYPNNDTDASNYTNRNLYFNPAGYGSSSNTPEARVVLCRVGWERTSQISGEAMMRLKPINNWRQMFSSFFLTNVDNYLWGGELQVGMWKNSSSTISSIRFAVRENTFSGRIRITALK